MNDKQTKRPQEDLETAAANMLAALLRARHGLQSLAAGLRSPFVKAARRIRTTQKRKESGVSDGRLF